MRRARNRQHNPDDNRSPLNGKHGCNGKRMWPDFHAASRMARNTRIGRDDPVHPYRCQFCHAWHVGSYSKPPEKRPKALPLDIEEPMANENSLEARIARFFEHNPDEELTHRQLAEKFGCTERASYLAINALRKQGSDIEAVHVIRLKVRGMAA